MAKARLEGENIVTYISEIPQGWEVLEGFPNYYIDENGSEISISSGINFNLSHLLSDEDWVRFGFYLYMEPEYDSNIQEIDRVEFNPLDFTYNAIIVDKTWPETLSNLKEQKIANLKGIYNNKLSNTDWVIIRNTELGVSTDQAILDERASLRSECAAKEAEINAITTKKNLALYELPNFM